MPRYTVIPHTFHRHRITGCKASIYGAHPAVSLADRANWETVTDGFTWSDSVTNTVGLCRAPMADRAEAQALADRLNAEWARALAEQAAFWEPIRAPITWTRAIGNDGSTVWHSGEGYTIRAIGEGWHQCEDAAQTPDLPAFRALAKAKAWCGQCIRHQRKEALTAA